MAFGALGIGVAVISRLYGIVWVGLGLSIFQQFVGINVIFYYSNVLWEAVGFEESQAFTITVITSLTNIVTTLIAIALIDKIGRKPLLLIGSTGMAITLGTMAVIFGTAPQVDGQPQPERCGRAHRLDRGQPLRGGVRYVVGPGGVGTARRDVLPTASAPPRWAWRPRVSGWPTG